VTISKQFFSGFNETTGLVFALLAFAAGFIVRPFGAVFFACLGDLIGRKYTFLATMLLMGTSSARAIFSRVSIAGNGVAVFHPGDVPAQQFSAFLDIGLGTYFSVPAKPSTYQQ
jgi:MFS family permease